MEIKATNTFIEFIREKHADIKLIGYALFVNETLPYVGASPNRILLCSCCEKACLKITFPYSINCTKPCYSNLEYLRFCDEETVEKVPHLLHTKHAADGCYWNYKNLFCYLDSPWNDY